MREERGPGFESHILQEMSPYNFVYFSPEDGPLVPVICPERKARTFSPGFVVPVVKSGLKPVPNRDYNLFLY